MKKNILTLTILAVTLIFAACRNNSNDTVTPPTVEPNAQEAYIDATSRTTWHYFSFAQNKFIGSGEDNAQDNTAWFARNDWDMAICRYTIRTNSGQATTIDSKGGVYKCSSDIKFNTLLTLPSNITFATDREITTQGSGGTSTTTIKSEAETIGFKTDDSGNMIMPPIYIQAPVCIFRTADGQNTYKVEFTQYQNENKVSGHVKFNYAKL